MRTRYSMQLPSELLSFKLAMDLQATKEEIASYSSEQLCEFLSKQGVDDDALPIFRQQRIRGADFINLKDDELKELFPIMGIRLSVARLVRALALTKVAEDREDVDESSTASSSVSDKYLLKK